ncbi:TPA: hypothetical protein I7745_22850, partial [Vibrio vulnificus]|nr:hypothetical protein [Vibrio vulnificus]
VDNFFRLTFEYCDALRESLHESSLNTKHRNSDDGGHLLFRPIGWDLYTQTVLTGIKQRELDMESVVKLANSKDLHLSGSILANKVWSTKQKRILKVSAKNQKLIEKHILAQ